MASPLTTPSRPINPDLEAAFAFDRGRDLLKRGDLSGAETCYRQGLALAPDSGHAHHVLGLIAAKRGTLAEAARLLERALAIEPGNTAARGTLDTIRRQPWTDTAAAKPDRSTEARAHYTRGLDLMQQGQLAAAVVALAQAASLDPQAPECALLLGEALRRQGHLAGALQACERGLAIRPDHAEGLNLRGLIHDAAGRLDQASADFETALRLTPGSAVVLNNIAQVRLKQHRLEEALAAADAVLAQDPVDPAALGNRGTVLTRLGRAQDAIDTFSRAIEREPQRSQHYSNLGALLVAMDQPAAAVSACGIAVKLSPNDPQAQFNHAVALRQSKQIPEAIAAYRAAHALGCAEALVDVVHLRQQICDWDGLAAEQAEARRTTYRLGKAVAPFSVITMTDEPAEQRLSGTAYAATFPKLDTPLAIYAPRPAARRQERIRVGYLSCDFYAHATTSLLVETIERHDRDRFEIVGYSYGPDDGSAMRGRVFTAFDRARDIRAVSYIDAARQIAADEIDILIDLKGYTQAARTEILAYRPAPIQVNYLGYPATMGAPFIDYIVGDAVVTPFGHAGQFSEKIVQLPGCYQPNDSRRPMAAAGNRAEFGLPETGFVFCCFNNSYKITPDVFEVWARLLHAIPGSVLWLLDTNPIVTGNLRREAVARGLAPERLVFAPRVRAEAHIGRMAVADLFLDTLPVNAHTTASEALWAGLPVLTCLGKSLVARVAGSLLQAIGLPELVTLSLADYEALALRLACDPDGLARLRARLATARATATMFDGAHYARHLDTALLHMQALREAGRPPEAFAVAALPSPHA